MCLTAFRALRNDLDQDCPHQLFTARRRDPQAEDVIPRIHLGDRDFDRSEPGADFGWARFAPGESERFLKLLEEYSKAPEVTRQRLYLEAMEEILPGITKFIVDSEPTWVALIHYWCYLHK